MITKLIHRATRPISIGERGATAVEYALMVALIVLVIAVAVALLGTSLQPIFRNAAAGI